MKKYLGENKKTGILDIIFELTGQDEDYIFEQISHKNLENDVAASIDKLSPKCREIFILSRYELLSYIEISEKLNISVNTVNTQISRALDTLRSNLRKYLKK